MCHYVKLSQIGSQMYSKFVLPNRIAQANSETGWKFANCQHLFKVLIISMYFIAFILCLLLFYCGAFFCKGTRVNCTVELQATNQLLCWCIVIVRILDDRKNFQF